MTPSSLFSNPLNTEMPNFEHVYNFKNRVDFAHNGNGDQEGQFLVSPVVLRHYLL